MSIPNQPPSTDGKWFNKEIPKPFKSNQRKSTRYIRNDIGITLRKIGLLNLRFLKNRDIPVKLVDISSRGVGVLIATHLRLTFNKKVVLIIRFFDFKEFEVAGTVVRVSPGIVQIYGIKFDHLNNELADYLLKTQTKLSFK
ncbi:PilZ domain-containing protein [Methyloglobulus morosus KoM1]|uniref:PilZ domain-containing protein n=1 Tax=Methyloglobulus morosus KoM1 TaxID=1116472 RepID=V5DZZ5_9GAMM|nr:PilZ domain-containing protein [Methyloglobulus morosus]ESS72871.1 PilZ domain-containing protein [Methyloglobulus morosus KoM1]